MHRFTKDDLDNLEGKKEYAELFNQLNNATKSERTKANWDNRLTTFYEEHGRMPSKNGDKDEQQLARRFARKNNQTDLFRDLREKEREQKAKAFGKELIQEVKGFIKRNGHFPRQSHGDEKALADKVNGALRRSRLTPEQEQEIDDLKRSHQVSNEHSSLHDRIGQLNETCKKMQEGERSGKPYEITEEENANIIELSRKKTQEKMSEDEYRLYTNLKKQYFVRYTYQNATDLLDDLKMFTEGHGYYPDRDSPNRYEARLGRSANKLKKDGAFSEEQLATLVSLKDTYQSKTGISVSEKILLLCLSDCLKNTRLNENERINGFEADISFDYNGRKYCVQYDGAFHSQKEAVNRDLKADKAHSDKGYKVIRVREGGCKDYPAKHSEIVSIPKELRKMTKKDAAECIGSVLSLIAEKSDYSYPCSKWDDCVSKAKEMCSSRADDVKLVQRYVGYVLKNQKAPKESSSLAKRIDGLKTTKRLTIYDKKLINALISCAKEQ